LTFPVNVGSDHFRGSIKAPTVVVEYGDYECHYTGMANPVVHDIMKQFGNQLYFVFRNFPLNDNIHPHAQHAQSQLKLRQLKANSGKYMIICLNIKKPWTILTW